MTENKEAGINDIIAELKKRKRKANIKLVLKAYDFANEKHKGQLRKSGEPYIIHPLQVAYILTTIDMDEATICAALLHDVVEDTEITHEDLIKEFGEEIANLVDGVTKLSKLQEYNEINDMRAIFMSKQIQNILEKLY